MASDVTLTPGIRSNLLSLTQTSKVVALTQARLATGLKVAKATDGAVDYFQANVTFAVCANSASASIAICIRTDRHEASPTR